MNGGKDPFKENTGLSLHEQYLKHHPQVLSNFEEEMPKLWGRKWKAIPYGFYGAQFYGRSTRRGS